MLSPRRAYYSASNPVRRAGYGSYIAGAVGLASTLGTLAVNQFVNRRIARGVSAVDTFAGLDRAYPRSQSFGYPSASYPRRYPRRCRRFTRYRYGFQKKKRFSPYARSSSYFSSAPYRSFSRRRY